MSATVSPTPGDAEPPPAPRRTDAPPYHGGGWTAIVREFAIIVAGVLCALAAQAWWDAHQESGRERDYLRQLLADTRANQRRLDAAIRTDSLVMESSARAMQVLTSTTLAPRGDSLTAWVLGAMGSNDFRPLDGNVRALLGTGDLRLIRSDSLRAMIAAYASSLAAEDVRQVQLRQALIDQAAPVAAAFPFMRRVFLDGTRLQAADVARLRADGRAVDVMFSLQASAANRLAGLRGLREQTLRVRRALQRETGSAAPDSLAD